MKRRGVAFMASSLAVVVSFLVVCLVVSVGVRQRTFDQGVGDCFQAISMRDPLRDVARDVARNERRFFFNGFNEWNLLRRQAIGAVPHRDASGRPLKVCVKDGPWRELPFRSFSRFRLVRHGDPFNGRADPIYSPRTACGKADDEYIRAYNAEMARLSPGSFARYCR